jgi:hypothetical protein
MYELKLSLSIALTLPRASVDPVPRHVTCVRDLSYNVKPFGTTRIFALCDELMIWEFMY